MSRTSSILVKGLVFTFLCAAAADVMADEPPFARFTLTQGVYHCDAAMDAAVKNEFGPQATVADWTTIRALFSEDIEAFCDSVGLMDYSSEAWCYADGEAWWETWRHYFVSRHNHDCPDWWLAHDNIDNHFLDLGSWCGDHPILVDLGVGLPVASTSDATEVTESSATLNGSVNDDGGETCEYRFRYKRSGDWYMETSWTGSVTTGESFSHNVSGLTSGSTYYFASQLRNSGGSGDWSEEYSFVTPGVLTSVQVQAPNGGEEFTAGSTVNIRWQTQGGITMILIELSVDGGDTWRFVASCSGSTGRRSWLVPLVNSDRCLLRISAGDDTSVCDESDDVFSIHGGPTSTTWYVDTAAKGKNDGTSWADAFVSLQDAMVRAKAGDEIWVAQGPYQPDVGGGQTLRNRAATFQLKDGVAVYGGFPTGGSTWAQRKPDLYDTVLNGDIGTSGVATDNSYHVVTASGTGKTAILDGFTITGGYANAISPNDSGAGIYNLRGSPLVRNCTFVANAAVAGSGGGACNIKSPATFINCVFNTNVAALYGGGMYNEANDVTVINCTFSANEANKQTGGVFNLGCTATLANCILWGNSNRQTDQFNEWAQVGGNQPQKVNYCCVAGWTGMLGGSGNLGDDPLFVDADGPDGIVGTPDDDLRLKASSPCINAGTNTSVPAGITTDLRGSPRVVDGIVDMGAYEDQGKSSRPPGGR